MSSNRLCLHESAVFVAALVGSDQWLTGLKNRFGVFYCKQEQQERGNGTQKM